MRILKKSLKITFINPNTEEQIVQAMAGALAYNLAENEERVTFDYKNSSFFQNSHEEREDKKTQKMNKILEICEQPKSLNEIMIELGYKSNRTLKREYINPLIEKGKLKRTIPDKPTSSNQKYISDIKE